MRIFSIGQFFVRRLLIGLVPSLLIVLVNIYDSGSRFFFSDASVLFFSITTGPLIGILSVWYHFLPRFRQAVAVRSTIIATYIFGALAFYIDLSHRVELDGLITFLHIGPQLLLLSLMITIFGQNDLSELRNKNVGSA